MGTNTGAGQMAYVGTSRGCGVALRATRSRRPRSTMRAKAVATCWAVSVVLLGGCSSGSGAGTSGGSATSSSDPITGVRWGEPYEALAAQVARDRGIPWEKVVGVTLISPTRGPAGTRDASPSPDPEAPRRTALQRALGLISEADAQAAPGLSGAHPQGVEVPGNYVAGRIEIADDGTISPADKRLLVHQMVLALDYQQLANRTPPEPADEHNAKLRVMQSQGDATLGERDYLASLTPSEGQALRKDTAIPGYALSIDDAEQVAFARQTPVVARIDAVANWMSGAVGIRALQALRSPAARDDLLIAPLRSQAALLSPVLLGTGATDADPVIPDLDRFSYRGVTGWHEQFDLSVVTLALALGAVEDPELGLDVVDAFGGLTAYTAPGAPCALVKLRWTGPKSGLADRAVAALASLRGGGVVADQPYTYSFCGEGATVTEAQARRAVGPIVYRLVIYSELLKAGIKPEPAQLVAQEFALDPKNADDQWEVLTGWPADPELVARAIARAQATSTAATSSKPE